MMTLQSGASPFQLGSIPPHWRGRPSLVLGRFGFGDFPLPCLLIPAASTAAGQEPTPAHWRIGRYRAKLAGRGLLGSNLPERAAARDRRMLHKADLVTADFLHSPG